MGHAWVKLKNQMGGVFLPLKPFSSLKTTFYFWRNLKFDRFAAKNLEHPRTSVEFKKKTKSEDVRKVYDIPILMCDWE